MRAPKRHRVDGIVVSLCCGAAVAACGGAANGRTTTGKTTAADAGAAKIRVNFVCATPALDPFYAPIEQGAKDAAREMRISLSYTGLSSTVSPAAMSQVMTPALDEHPAALITCDYFPPTQAPLIRQAVAEHIPVIDANAGFSDAASAGAIASVGQSETLAGQQAGERMIAAGVRHPLCVNQSPANPSTTARCTGMATAYKAQGLTIRVLDIPLTQYKATGAQEAAIRGTLAADHNIDGVLVLGGAQAVAAVQAVQQEGMTGRITVGGFDLTSDIVSYITNGTMLFTVWQQPYLQGYLPVVLAALAVRHGFAPPEQVLTGPTFVTKANIAVVKRALAAGLA